VSYSGGVGKRSSLLDGSFKWRNVRVSSELHGSLRTPGNVTTQHRLVHTIMISWGRTDLPMDYLHDIHSKVRRPRPGNVAPLKEATYTFFSALCTFICLKKVNDQASRGNILFGVLNSNRHVYSRV
jgi:hypothetical protein